MLEEATVEALKAAVRGELLRPGDTGYDDARKVWNALIDRRPALIVKCSGTADVVSCVNFARAHALPISVRGGGHNIAGSGVCDKGLMVDLSAMKEIQVDSAARTARVEPGATWGELDRKTQAFGLATTGGICSETGVAGLALGGGFG